MKITKVINNNVVSALKGDKEIVAMGKGIGYKAKVDMIIDETKIEKIFTMDSQTSIDKFKQLLENLPIEHFELSTEIITYAKNILCKRLNQNIYITLTDHINFAIERFRNGMVFSNPLLWDVKQFYKSEYLIGEYAVNLIEKRLNVKMTEDEAANIALHIVNAEYNTDMKDAMKITILISDILNIVTDFFNIQLDIESLNYSRFITHLKFLSQRLFTKSLLENTDKIFANMITSTYPKEFECSLKIKNYIENKYKQSITDEELIYLAVHIKRVCMFVSNYQEQNDYQEDMYV